MWRDSTAPPPYQDALRGCGCVPLAHCEQAAPLHVDTAGSCAIRPNEAAVGSGAIVSAVAESQSPTASESTAACLPAGSIMGSIHVCAAESATAL
eukprot:SAG25_NODE_10759_length_323_cov_1.138393_1_plen_94_part_01